MIARPRGWCAALKRGNGLVATLRWSPRCEGVGKRGALASESVADRGALGASGPGDAWQASAGLRRCLIPARLERGRDVLRRCLQDPRLLATKMSAPRHPKLRWAVLLVVVPAMILIADALVRGLLVRTLAPDVLAACRT